MQLMLGAVVLVLVGAATAATPGTQCGASNAATCDKVCGHQLKLQTCQRCPGTYPILLNSLQTIQGGKNVDDNGGVNILKVPSQSRRKLVILFCVSVE